MTADEAARIADAARFHAEQMLESVAACDLDAARHHRRAGLELLLSLRWDDAFDRRLAETMLDHDLMRMQ
jgi:hypothetical protein